ncbi:MAG: helix-turn-helix transcriptional regulator [Candidatus Accumulibacter sp.]|jgi:transcriptional regulator with XRE-family HTH domain|nr:helix-turn-helix transcriptional regulator [Accumulibacter sp.]
MTHLFLPSRFPGDRIKTERLRLGYKTQGHAADKFGVTRETWSRYESGKYEMGKEVYQRFIEAGADPDFLTTGIAREIFEASISQAGLPAHMQVGQAGREAALLRHWRFLPEPLQEQVSKLAETLANLYFHSPHAKTSGESDQVRI